MKRPDFSFSSSAYAREIKDTRMLGYLCTTWGKASVQNAAERPPVKDVLATWRR